MKLNGIFRSYISVKSLLCYVGETLKMWKPLLNTFYSLRLTGMISIIGFERKIDLNIPATFFNVL